MRLFVSISFNGGAYSGWQIQKNAISVQAVLERALTLATGETISVIGAGRTDAGVNAKGFIAHFDISPECTKKPEYILGKMNAILPSDIIAHNICQVADDAHARFDAISRTYRYYIHTEKDPFAIFSYHYKHRLDVERMNIAAQHLLGTKDFSSFEKVGSDNNTSICTVTSALWERIDKTHLCFEVTADRFLRNMVRAMVGTLLDVGRGKREPEWIAQLIEEKERCKAGQSVPGHALFLTEVRYPYPIFENNKK